MKKALVILLTALMLITSLYAEGSKEVASDQPIVIEFWTHEDANRQPLEARLIEEFCATHPNVTVNVTVQGSEKLRELVQTAFAAGEGPTMFNLSINDEYPLIAAGRVAPMDYAAAGYKNA
ncbi:MAG: extracellular solute-binding protein, partial [Spirochaetales bacterium]|nr:extracellular solute-binding protein [Spirochaetales bacterium]